MQLIVRDERLGLFAVKQGDKPPEVPPGDLIPGDRWRLGIVEWDQERRAFSLRHRRAAVHSKVVDNVNRPGSLPVPLAFTGHEVGTFGP
ncbi:hypothetical protein, partial [Methylobacterium sp. 37f]|uniref:hypothetical protein n=1 Tax=Methylobacterium sp. 37f TaxID=2817058 RepID=UPI001FFC61CB